MIERLRYLIKRLLASGRDDRRRERWEERTDWPLLILAAAMLPLLLLQFVVDVDQQWDNLLDWISWLIWAVFAVDLAVRLWLAEDRRRFLINNWIDVLIVVIPFLRPLRSLRALRLLRAAAVLSRIPGLLDRRGVRGTLLLAAVVMVGATAAVWVTEHEAGGEVRGWDSAFWWTLSTMVSGDGVKAAETVAGRVLGGAVTLLGFALLGLVTATIAAWFVEQEQDDDLKKLKREQRETLKALHELQREVRLMRKGMKGRRTYGRVRGNARRDGPARTVGRFPRRFS